MHIQFSLTGFILLLMMFVPNIIWIKKMPKGYTSANENRLLLILERVGQAMVCLTALFPYDSNAPATSAWTLWLVSAFIVMLMYEAWWIRYFRSYGTLADFYDGFIGIPLPGAVLPVAAFLLLGIYRKAPLLIVFVLVLGVGHIGIHLQHWIEMRS